MLSIRFSLFLLLALALVALVSSDDLKKCEDGSYVSRDPKTGEFFPCKPNTNPNNNPTPSDSSDDNNNNDFPPSPTCKKDFYMCPDGTFVGRSGKDCAFPACQCLSNIKTCEDGSTVGTDPTTCEFLPCPNNNNNNNNEPVVCPTDLFLCVDGSFASRDPKTCEFLTCNPPKNPNQPSSNSGEDSDSNEDDSSNDDNDGVSISEAIQSFPQTVDFAQYIISIQSSTMESVAPIFPWMKMKQYSHHGYYHSENHHHSRYTNKQVILVYMGINTPPLKDLPHRYYSFPVFYAVQTVSLDYETYSCPFRPVVCPDGSYWSLTGKDCNYASCPVVIEVTMDSFNPIPADSESEEDSSIIGVVLATLVFPLGIILLGMCVCYCRRRSSSRACSRKASNWKGYSEDKVSLLPQTTTTPLSVPPTPFPTKKSPTQQKVSQPQQPQQQQRQTFTIVNSPQIQDFMVPSPSYGMLPSFPALNPYFLPVDQNGNFNYQIPVAFQPPMYPMMYNPQEQQQEQQQQQQGQQ